MPVQSNSEVHPVVIIGSGAAGGMAAWNLTRQGVNVTMLDAGRKFNRSEFWTHVKPWEWQQHLDAGHKPPQIVLDTAEQPYITPLGQDFQLTRVWGRGGKTNIWGRVSLRYSDLDFTGPERDGWEIPWPIRYKDIAPYYDQVDQLIGVCGGDDDQDSLPGSKYFLPPPPLRCGEWIMKNAAQESRHRHRCHSSRRTHAAAQRSCQVPLLRSLRLRLRCRRILQLVGLLAGTGTQNRPPRTSSTTP